MTPPTPPGPDPALTAAAYRITGYADGLVGAAEPECDLLLPHWDSGLKWLDENNPQPGDWCWDGGVAGGVTWDGTFHRDLTRYAASGPLFWSAYLKAGTSPGSKNGYWLNFGSGWAHLHNDDPAQILSGASQRLFYIVGPVPSPGAGGGRVAGSGDPAYSAGHWKLVIEATMFVTGAVVDVWTGVKTGGENPAGVYNRVSGCDPLATLTVEASP
ncbi:MAG: hypothetical protein NT105_15735 [Verrucomicrobia bacterium]|nr:hypothetical protein [Verrucomicrobiota bacterium]